jgi:hypothetical protein
LILLHWLPFAACIATIFWSSSAAKGALKGRSVDKAAKSALLMDGLKGALMMEQQRALC